MKNKSSEKDEAICLDKVISPSSDIRGRYARSICKRLMSIREQLQPDESPDFIYYDENMVFGLEHCLVDGLPNDKGDSFSRTTNHRILNIIDKRDGDLEKDMGEICPLVSDVLNCINNFSYDNFIKNFKRICSSHNLKCEKDNDYGYKNHLRTFSSNIEIGCLIDIPITYACRQYIVNNNGKSTEKYLPTIPFTHDMLDIIEDMSAFDFIIVCVHSTKYINVRCFDPKNMHRCIRQQNIDPCDYFEYKKPSKTSIKYRKINDTYEIK